MDEHQTQMLQVYSIRIFHAAAVFSQLATHILSQMALRESVVDAEKLLYSSDLTTERKADRNQTRYRIYRCSGSISFSHICRG